MHKFKVGDKVKLINKKEMAAKIGATAIVTGYSNYMDVQWDREDGLAGGQMDGGYNEDVFELAVDLGVIETIEKIVTTKKTNIKVVPGMILQSDLKISFYVVSPDYRLVRISTRRDKNVIYSNDYSGDVRHKDLSGWTIVTPE